MVNTSSNVNKNNNHLLPHFMKRKKARHIKYKS
jgi:hypothetical protein